MGAGGEGKNKSETEIKSEGAYIPLAMVATITREVGANEIASENGRLRAYVQANVQDRDLGGFVNDVEAALRKMNWASMTYKMTGDYENQRRFTQTMQVVFPAVMLIIFVMLYMVYHSAAEAAHVLLAVPFALSGGVHSQDSPVASNVSPGWTGMPLLVSVPTKDSTRKLPNSRC